MNRRHIKYTIYTVRQLLALPFFALGAVLFGIWSIITGKY